MTPEYATLLMVFAFAALVAGFAAVVTRHRRATEEQRRAIRMMRNILAVTLIAVAVAPFLQWFGLVLLILVVMPAFVLGLPLAFVIAVLSHRLYEVDLARPCWSPPR